LAYVSWEPFALTHRDFNLAKQRHDLLRAEMLLRHDQAPFQASFYQNAWSKKARSGHWEAKLMKSGVAGAFTQLWNKTLRRVFA